MTCPPDIAIILLDILRHGLLACRAAGWRGDPDGCAIQADHLHNLPDLMADYSVEKLRYYWEVERPAFAVDCPREERDWWDRQWERLRVHVEAADELIGSR
jgi:hypothetical protein